MGSFQTSYVITFFFFALVNTLDDHPSPPPSVTGCLAVARDVVISYTDMKAIDYVPPLKKIQEQKCRIKIFHATQTL